MSINTTKMSSKGQIVIPQSIREEIHATDGTLFAITSNKDTVVLKKIKTPTKEEIIKDVQNMSKIGSLKAKKQGIKESDILNIIDKVRKEKR